MPESGRSQELHAKATSFYHSGEYRQAIQIWQEILQSDPENQRAKEGIQMAALLLEEAQISEQATDPAPAEAPSGSPEGIARIREGIQKVREFLAASQHLKAMEVCQSLLKLAPRSEAVREILEEAREAYEAQPFIAEHLEIARQLFVQDRFNEASVELQKIFFLNSAHAEARKLEAKILARKEREVPQAHPAGSPAPASGSETQKIAQLPDLDNAPAGADAQPHGDAPAGAPSSPAPGPEEGERGFNLDWEADLANLRLGPSGPESSPAPAAAPVEPEEPIPLADLSEPIPAPAAKRGEGGPSAAAAPAASTPSGLPDFDLSQIQEDLPRPAADSEPAVPPPTEKPKAIWEKRPVSVRERREAVQPAMSPRRGSPAGVIVAAMMILVAGGAAWWYFGDRGASASGNGNQSDSPNRNLIPRRTPVAAPAEGGTSNLGLSSSGSRGSSAAKAGVELPGPPPADSIPVARPSPEEARREISELSSEGRSRMAKGDYAEAVKVFSKILDLDPANVEVKEQMDQAAAKVLEQKKLEEDLQSGKEFFMDKDYESALRKFYRLPRNRNLGDLDLFMRNAWYNWAVLSMKGGNCPQALQRLEEVLTLDPGDQEAIRQKEVAEHYRDRPKDRVFFAYTDRLTYRTLNQR